MNKVKMAPGLDLYNEFSDRLGKLKQEGLVDFKMKVFSGRDTSVDGVVLTLNNVLRLREERKETLVRIDIA